ncbi:RNA polymerase sigma factor [Marixanthomonas ophiurae]|uniref:Sigma-70 family RNA polymerase sigma factor n=1 Tax=Marixanthomonas ophiurae TaxID=387659 RepID=A0A3E1Q9P6_9FLAO|nr:sigma-70 family RNA polymerase sigma factor [Marixanthomonas ophiurae]RFN58856.1 sigma-70 family RNA polymerase sigma factor [Marixanthomonas ophiurae]
MGEIKYIEKQFQLITAIKGNNERALHKLYTENFYKTEQYVLKNNGTMPQAKDIYQEAFIAVWRNIKDGKFVPKNETAVQGYLYQIAKYKWLDYLRSSRFKKTTSLEPLENNLEIDISETINTETEIKHKQTMNAFEKLGAECKKLLTDFYYNKKSMRKIASEFNIEEASARNKKYRCINKLRALTLSPTKS